MDFFDFIDNEIKADYFQDLIKFLKETEKTKIVYPKKEDRLNAFRYTPFNKVKVVLVGQDPYHGKNQAHGLAFSVLNNNYPPSLQNIFKELVADLNISYPKTGNLTSWAKEGVLLLNTILTVEENKPLSHQDKGWEVLFEKIISLLSKNKNNLVFILWGNNARSYERLIDKTKHLVIKSVHPSPLSSYRGFFGSKPFSKTNEYLIKNNIEPINWRL